MQTLDVKISIPETHVLISVDEYNDLKERELTGKYYTIKDLVNLTGKSESWLYDNLLNNPYRRKDIRKFTHYPKGKGDRWLFKATGLREYLENEFLEILRR
ncbi:DUF771 domain-containing protein [Jeotgalicoccus sp. WY2]|uniref:DUF771 domain-containing protein n=1 Tax=Jeotgalicoccus sp. WY2 TaxID=2708346 RepID=UPI001BD36B11|nr:DUF771 domain-containing protein [Jeotgalicoccus sp. WY2]